MGAGLRGKGRWLEPILALPHPLLLAFDVDGTLAPIARDPWKARVPGAVVRDLRSLGASRDLRLAVVTGRDPGGLANVLAWNGLYRGVLHGKLVLAPGEPAKAPPLSARQARALDAFGRFLRRELKPEGAVLEEKPGSWGVHVRVLSERDPEGAAALLETARREAVRLGLHAREGRALVEVEARSGDKGRALARIHRMSRARAVVFLGDDLTDLPALRYASEHGLSLFVRSRERPRRPPGVHGSLPDVRAVHQLVSELARELGR